MSDREPVGVWIERIRAGDEAAASKLWETYYDQLIRLVCHRLRGARRRAADEEDVVARAFEAFFRCVKEKDNGLPELKNSEDLWQFLVTITDRKAKNLVRAEKRKKRGGGLVRGESGFYGNTKKNKAEEARGADQFPGDAPSPEFTATMLDYFGHLLDLLDDDLREVALLKLEGIDDAEIARHIGRSTRTVNRRLGLIRKAWKEAEKAEA